MVGRNTGAPGGSALAFDQARLRRKREDLSLKLKKESAV